MTNKMLPQLSERLQTVADMVTEGRTVADIGTDHGFVPIYLIGTGKASRVIAMDVRSGPLDRAKSHVIEYNYETQIECRLSDGMEKLLPGEAQTITCAGMGGPLMQKIIEKGNPRELGITEMILQPQSDIVQFRMYLRDNDYEIVDEQLILEEGKYYMPMKIRVKCGKADTDKCEAVDKLTKSTQNDDIIIGDILKSPSDAYSEGVKILVESIGISVDEATRACYRFGPVNIRNKSEALYSLLCHDKKVCEGILPKLSKEEHADRYNEVSNELSDITNVLKLF